MKTLIRSLAVVTFLALSTFVLPLSSTLPSASSSRIVSASSPNSSLRPVSISSAFAFQASPTITAVKSATLAVDVDNDTRSDPGDTLEYSVVVSNTGTASATGLTFTDTIDANTTLVAGSVMTTPVAANDSFTASGNIQITIAAPGVLANDFDLDGVGPALTVTGPTMSTQGGNVTLSANGALTYNPPAGFEGTDTFTYTLSDGEGNTDTATVAFTVTGMIWFIDVNAASNGDGRLSSPFNTLAAFNAVNNGTGNNPSAGDNIFLYESATSYAGPLTLLNNQRLIGQDATASVSAITGITPPAGSLPLPATNTGNGVIVNLTSGSNAVNVGQGNLIRGLTIGNTTGAGISGSGFGTLTVSDVTITGNGQALSLTNGTLAATFASLSSTNSGGTGISLSTVAGSMTSGSTSITNPSGIGISVASSSANLNFGGTSSTGSGGAGVSLTTNTGTITFGALTITPDASQRGLVATDNTNTITATSGTITTSGAAAVEITRASSTTPLQISLTSVSTNGGTNGIILTNTSGSFTVTGTSGGLCGGQVSSGPPASAATTTAPVTADCTGGTIQNTSGPGVVLTNASNISFTRLWLRNSGDDGVRGTNVTGFTLASSLVENNGNAVGEANLDFGDVSSASPDGLHGTGSITNSTIQGSFEQNVSIRNFGGAALTSFNVTGSQFRNVSANTQSGDGILFEASGTANMTISVTGSFFAGNRGDHFQAAGVNSGTLNVNFTNNTLTGGHSTALGQGITISAATGVALGGYTGRVDYDINGNNINGSVLSAAHAFLGTSGAAAVFDGFIRNNVIGTSGMALSGSTQANGVYVEARGNGTHHSLVTGNTIRQCFDRGILSEAGDGSGVLNLTVQSNIIDQQVGTDTREAIQTNYGITSTNVFGVEDAPTICLQLGGAGALANTFSHGGGAPDDFRLRKRFSATVRLPGYSGGTGQDATSLDQVVAFIRGQNTGSAGEPGSAAASGSGGGYTGGAACMAPSAAFASQGAIVSARTVESTTGDGDSRSFLQVAGVEVKPDDLIGKLLFEELTLTFQAAIERWRQADISVDDLARLQNVSFEITDLPDSELARKTSTGIQIDATAAGYGWFFDATPLDDEEFRVGVPDRELQTTELSIAHGKFDLLTVVIRELAKEYLKDKKRVPKKLRPLMEPTLSPSVRRLIDASKIHFIIPQPDVIDDTTLVGSAIPDSSGSHSSDATVSTSSTVSPQSGESVTLGPVTLPPAESFTVSFRVTIDNPFPNGDCDVANTAMVSGSNFTAVTSNTVTTDIFIAPTITCPANISVNTDAGLCTAAVTFNTTSNGCPVPTVTCTPIASGGAFPLGTTTVTCTATNSEGSVDCSFTVTVTDNQPPSITCPANITQGNDADQCSAIVSFSPTANDNCPNPSVVCAPASASTFPLGTTTVTCTVTDEAGLSANCSFTVTINDTQAPTLTPCPANITTPAAAGQCSATVNYTAPAASDNCPSVGAVACAPASGSVFPVGLTTVTCSVTDAAGNPANCSFTVTVQDTQPPQITCPANISVPTPAGCVTVNYMTPSPTDNCPSPTVVCAPMSGTCFPVGTTTVTCTATDASGNTTSCMFTVSVIPCTISCPANVTESADKGDCSAVVAYPPPTTLGDCGTVSCTPASGSSFPVGITTVTCATSVGPSCTFTVTVTDDQPPSAICPSNIVTNNTSGQCSAAVNFSASAEDNCPGATVVCTPPSGSTFPVGTTTVSCTATDAAGNTSPVCTFSVTVNDTEPPAVTCPAGMTVASAAGQCSAVVNFTASATDNCPGTITPVCTPASGSTFPVGVTTVSCTATDGAGNVSTPCTFTVTVNDTEPPQISCPTPITVGNAAGQCSTVVNFSVMATDNCPGVTVITNPPSGSSFPLGTTTVMATATDGSGNTSSCTFTVTVNDTEAPEITCPPTQNAPPGVVTYPDPEVTDNCPGASFICNPPSGSTFPAGVSTVSCTATDSAGNTTSCTFTVTTFDVSVESGTGGLMINTVTGDYQFCCGGMIVNGRGRVSVKGCIISLQQGSGETDRRVLATIDRCRNTGTATLQMPAGTVKCTITDRNLNDNAFNCRGGSPQSQKKKEKKAGI